MANHLRSFTLKDSDREELERLLRASTTPAGLSRRARAVLLMVEGVPGVEIARRIGYTWVQGQPNPSPLRRGRPRGT